MNQQIFLNEQVNIDLLPRVEAVRYASLQKSYRTLQLITLTFTVVVFCLATWIGLSFADVPARVPLAGVGLWLFIGLIQVVFIVKGFPHKGYAVRHKDIVYKRGWLYKKQTTIPFSRIQHVDVRQGILERAYNLGKVNVYTAGGQGSDLTIPGLPFAEAQRIKAFILGSVMNDEEE